MTKSISLLNTRTPRLSKKIMKSKLNGKNTNVLIYDHDLPKHYYFYLTHKLQYSTFVCRRNNAGPGDDEVTILVVSCSGIDSK